MPAGLLRHRVTIEANAAGRGGIGAAADDWQPVATVWARVEPLEGRELEIARQIHAETTHRVTIRWREDVTSTHRLNFGGRLFYIISVLTSEEWSFWLTLQCREVIP